MDEFFIALCSVLTLIKNKTENVFVTNSCKSFIKPLLN